MNKCQPKYLKEVISVNASLQGSVAKVIKVEDLAHVLSIGRNTAYELVRSGKIRSVKIGRTYRIPLTAVEDYLNASDETGIM